MQDAGVAGLETRVKAKVTDEAKFIADNTAQADSEVTRGRTGDTPLDRSMKNTGR